MNLNKLNKVILYTVCLLSFLVGCTESKDLNNDNNEPFQNSITNKIDITVDAIDYNSFSKKIWISEQDMSLNDLFIYINHIDNVSMEGVLYRWKLPISSYFYYNPPFDERYPWNLEGKIIDNTIEGELTYGGVSGNILLVVEDSKIIGNIEVPDESELKDIPSDNNNFKFRPYTLSDVVTGFEEDGGEVIILSDYAIEANLDSWGDIKLLPLMVKSNKSHPIFYLVNENNEILYQLDAPFQNGLDVTEISLDDIDGNGLTDIIIILGDEDESVGSVVAWVFYQVDNLFYVDYKTQRELNIEFYDTTNLDAREVKEYLKSMNSN